MVIIDGKRVYDNLEFEDDQVGRNGDLLKDSFFLNRESTQSFRLT